MLTAALIVQFCVEVPSNWATSVPLGALVPKPPSQFFQLVLLKLAALPAFQIHVLPLAAAWRLMPNTTSDARISPTIGAAPARERGGRCAR